MVFNSLVLRLHLGVYSCYNSSLPPTDFLICELFGLLEEQLQKMPINLPHFLVGDLNVDLIEINRKSSRPLNIFISFELRPSINISRRVTDKSATFIDKKFSNVHPDSPCVVVSDSSDHFGVFSRYVNPLGNCFRLKNEFS